MRDNKNLQLLILDSFVEMSKALLLIVSTSHIEEYLETNDPKALQQITQALASAEKVTREISKHVR